MNFKFKALVAAGVVAMTMSSAANAITVGTDGEMFLAVFDSTSNNSFIKALGTTALTFDGSTNFTASLAGDANWATFLSSSTLATTDYQVLGFSAGATDKQGDSLMRTTATFAPNGAALSNGSWATLYNDVAGDGGGLNLWMTNPNIGNATVTGTSSKYIAAKTIDDSAGVLQNNWETQWLNGIDTTAALNTNNGFYTVTRGPVVPRGQISIPVVTSLLGNWNLNAAGNLTYTTAAVVPEADTWAMMLLGLGFMGFAARRKQA